MVLHYVTKVWSDVPWDWPRDTTARRRSNGYISTIRLPDAPSNVRPGARGRGGPGHNPGGLLGAVRRKKLTACYRHSRIDPHRIRKFANKGIRELQ